MPKIVNHGDQRDRIAEAAVQVIGTTGLDKVRLVDVARAANATTGTITHYFDGKDALLLAALKRVAEHLIATIESPRDGSLIEQAAAALPVDETTRASWRVWLSFWGRAIADPSLADVNNRYYARVRASLAQAIQLHQAQGEIDSILDPGDAADAVIAAVDGVGTRAVLAPDEWPPERQRALMKAILSSIFQTPTGRNHARRKT